jgi:hypothetical protein
LLRGIIYFKFFRNKYTKREMDKINSIFLKKALASRFNSSAKKEAVSKVTGPVILNLFQDLKAAVISIDSEIEDS